MITSIYLGLNTSKVLFTHFSTFRFFEKKGYEQNENAITSLFKKIDGVSAMNYNIERGGDQPSNLHIHALLNLSNPTLFNDQLIKYVNPNKINTCIRKVLAKIKKGNNDHKNDVNFKDCWVNVECTEYRGKKIIVEIENLIDTTNAALYSYKYSSYGITNGYLQKN